jgi:hypothetical protein
MSNWFTRHWPAILAFIFIVIGLTIGICFLIDLSKDYQVTGDGKLQTEQSAQVGEFMAGVVGTVFTLAGFIFIYLTYRNQVNANEKEKVQARFYHLLTIHIDNADQMTYDNPYHGR